MYRIVTKRSLHETVTLMEVEAPYIAKKAKPGQFIILRVDDDGERVPLTVAGTDPVRGTVTIIYQKVGYTTKRLDCLNEGDSECSGIWRIGVSTEVPVYTYDEWLRQEDDKAFVKFMRAFRNQFPNARHWRGTADVIPSHLWTDIEVWSRGESRWLNIRDSDEARVRFRDETDSVHRYNSLLVA